MQSILHHSCPPVYFHCVLGKFTSLAFQCLFPHINRRLGHCFCFCCWKISARNTAPKQQTTIYPQHTISDIIMANCLVFIRCAFVLSLHSARDFCPLSPTQNLKKKEGNIKSGLACDLMGRVTRWSWSSLNSTRRLLCNDNFPLKVLNQESSCCFLSPSLSLSLVLCVPKTLIIVFRTCASTQDQKFWRSSSPVSSFGGTTTRIQFNLPAFRKEPPQTIVWLLGCF